MKRYAKLSSLLRGTMGRDGLTLIEVLSSLTIMIVSVVALLSAFMSQTTLNEHSRNMSWAANDAERVLEELELQNGEGSGCSGVNTAPPGGFASWDAWLNGAIAAGGGGGKSVPTTPATNELVSVIPTVGADPNRVTVAVVVCWRYRNRVVGECANAPLVTSDLDGDGTIESPVQLSTILTCHP